jgi:hypothetical protein
MRQLPSCFQKLQTASRNGYGDCVSLLREPDAANPHVRFDERGVETEAWWDFQGTAHNIKQQQQVMALTFLSSFAPATGRAPG